MSRSWLQLALAGALAACGGSGTKLLDGGSGGAVPDTGTDRPAADGAVPDGGTGGNASGSGGVDGGGAGGSAGTGGGGGGAGGSAGVTTPELTWVKGTCSGTTGTINFETAEFCVSLTRTSQTIAALKPKVASGFDFTPADLLASRATAGYFHLGDITLRWRTGTSGAWQNATTSASRTPVMPMTASGSVLAAADLSPALPAGLPLVVKRSWLTERGRLILRFELTNTSSAPVQVGALGLPMVFNNVITGRTLEQAHATCSFSDPYIGRDAGYVQVTRLSGQGPALLVLPDRKTPLEAYGPILNAPKPGSKDPVAIFTDLTPRNQTFEGFHEWLVHSKAYADGEWSGARQWNAATDATLAPGETRSYGVQLVLSDQIRNIEKTLARELRPVAVGIPGYVLPTDVEGKLFLQYPAAVDSTSVEPSGALSVAAAAPTTGGWKSYVVTGKTWGRSRLTITYQDGTVQTIHYYVTRPAAQAMSDMGSFLTTKAWFVNAADPFGRSPSVMTYDHELDHIVTQSRQAWVCGLGDDGGATWLAGAMKLFGQPDPAQIAKYQQFVDGPLWGGLQYRDGALQYGVKRTLFYYEPTLLPTGTYDSSVAWKDPATGATYWGAWSKAHTLETPRSYNYPHVAALYWTMYRLARNSTGLVTNHPWDWYLNQAYRTSTAMTTIGDDYSRYGLMDGTVFLEILRDLEREGMTTQAADLKSQMKARADVWNTETYPFGSEMAWDSTGQEEVYAWTRYFGYTAKAKVCVDAVTGYTPAIPHWGYNGCARRYWDFLYGGSKTDRIERMLHHYGSSLNAIPVLTEYRDHPDDLHLLRIGYGGIMGALSAIDQDGFPSMAFHSFPDTLKWDPITGDVGLSVFGLAYNTATYVIQHPELGWQAFGGNLSIAGSTVRITPVDAFRKRFYVAPLGLWLTLDAGQLQTVELDTQTRVVRVTLAPSGSNVPAARVRIEQPAAMPGVGTYTVTGSHATERGASVIPLGAAAVTITLTQG